MPDRPDDFLSQFGPRILLARERSRLLTPSLLTGFATQASGTDLLPVLIGERGAFAPSHFLREANRPRLPLAALGHSLTSCFGSLRPASCGRHARPTFEGQTR